MATDYEQIRTVRTDITDWILHLTKGFEQLKEIVKDGYLKPGLAPRTSVRTEESKATVRGPYPAVCFTEMPLWAVKGLASTTFRTPRYFPYGVAFPKARLFDFGARPVIYGKTDILGRELAQGEPGYVQGFRIHVGGLPVDLQYLWVHLDLEGPVYPTDWTHEREWRCRIDSGNLDLYGVDGVPLELGQWCTDRPPTFKLIVKTHAQADELRQFIQALTDAAQAPGVDPEYYKSYVARTKHTDTQIVVIDDVVGSGHKTGRVETYF
jgi:hypothetical protein